jgi:hypothetical protein
MKLFLFFVLTKGTTRYFIYPFFPILGYLQYCHVLLGNFFAGEKLKFELNVRKWKDTKIYEKYDP